MTQEAGAKFDLLSKLLRGNENKLKPLAEDFEDEDLRKDYMTPIVVIAIIPLFLCLLLCVWWLIYFLTTLCCCKAKDSV